MPFLTNRRVILAKMETQEGTDASPAAATEALPIMEPKLDIEGVELDRTFVSPTLSPYGFVVGIRRGRATFKTELKNYNRVLSAASPLREDCLYRAAGLIPLYGSSSVIYTPSTAACTASVSQTATLYIWQDGVRHILKGCRANATLDMQDGQFGTIAWDLQGTWDPITASTSTGDIADVALPTPTFDNLGVVPPTIMGCVFALGSYSAVIEKASLAFNNDVQDRPDITEGNGLAGFYIVKRAPGGSLNPEAVPRGTFDFWYKWLTASTSDALKLYINPGALGWNEVRVDIPKPQFKVPKSGERGLLETKEMDYLCVRAASAGDDEFSIMYRAN